nr:ATP-binding protein [Cognataquiflexum nitidum]
MVFKDRIEVLNPGTLPLGWSPEKLKRPHASVPFNPLLAEPMYLKGYIERLGTGTADMVRIAKENKLQEPVFEQLEDFKTILYRPSTDQALRDYLHLSVEIKNLLKVFEGEMSRQDIQAILGLKHAGNFRENYLEPAFEDALILMKYPENPNHPSQKYSLSNKGHLYRQQLVEGLHEGVSEGVKVIIEGVNEGVKAELEFLYLTISESPGKKANELKVQIDKSKATTERHLKLLKELGLIEYRGAPKTGGYFVKD